MIHRQGEQQKQYYASLLTGLAMGASPWIIGAIHLGPQALLQELFGSAIAGLSGEGLLGSILAHFRNLLLFGPTVVFGLRPPWSTQALLPILAIIPILFWSGVAVLSYRRSRQQGLAYSEKILLGSAGFLLAGFVLTPFGGDPSGRYFLPLTLTMAVLAGGAFDWLTSNGRKRLGIIFVTLVLLYHAGSTFQAALRDSDGLTTQFDPVAQLDFSNFPALISLLEAKEIQYGYTNYWVAYPLAFKSDEEIIFTPRLPYHQDFRYTTRDNRYPPYSEKVEAADRVAYITTNHEALNRVLMKSFTDLGVQYQWAYLEPFMVFFDLSAPVRPDQINWPEGTMGHP
jgi:hypothetical protein